MSTFNPNKGELSRDRIANMKKHCQDIIDTLAIKNPKYGESWKSHGGFSAFFNTQRKWSRLENLASKHNFDIFEAMQATSGEPDGMFETMKDLVGYMLLILDDQEKLLPASECELLAEDCIDLNCRTHGVRNRQDKAESDALLNDERADRS